MQYIYMNLPSDRVIQIQKKDFGSTTVAYMVVVRYEYQQERRQPQPKTNQKYNQQAIFGIRNTYYYVVLHTTNKERKESKMAFKKIKLQLSWTSSG